MDLILRWISLRHEILSESKENILSLYKVLIGLDTFDAVIPVFLAIST